MVVAVALVVVALVVVVVTCVWLPLVAWERRDQRKGF